MTTNKSSDESSQSEAPSQRMTRDNSGYLDENLAETGPPPTEHILPPEDPPTLWWLSFVNPTKPPGEQFHGAAVAGPATTLLEAVLVLEEFFGPLPEGLEVAGARWLRGPVVQPRVRLLNREEAYSLGGRPDGA